MLYLDHAATTPVLPAALQAAWPFLTSEYGNPSSTHQPGLTAKNAMDWARQTCADFLGCRSSEIIFTSGGTESNNLAIMGIALANPRGKHIISAKTEHNAVLASLDHLQLIHGFEITYLPVAPDGLIAADDLAAALRPDTTLVTLMLANNETGAVQDISALAAIAATHKVPFHTDAVQAAGWFDLDVTRLGVSALSLSGHKFGAPKGSGLLYLKQSLDCEPVLHGGGQEFGFRSGTQNVAWAVAIAAALAGLLSAQSAEGVDSLKDGNAAAHQVTDWLITQVLQRFPAARLLGPALGTTAGTEATGLATRHPAIAAFTFEGIFGETLLLELERNGVVVSSGSACAAGSQEPSHVLLALGIQPEVCQSAVRFSFDHSPNMEQAAEALRALEASMRAIN